MVVIGQRSLTGPLFRLSSRHQVTDPVVWGSAKAGRSRRMVGGVIQTRTRLPVVLGSRERTTLGVQAEGGNLGGSGACFAYSADGRRRSWLVVWLSGCLVAISPCFFSHGMPAGSSSTIVCP